MTRLTAAARWLWEFVVGDDPWLAAGVALALGVTAGVAALGVAAWWAMPVAIVVLLAAAVRR